MSETSAALLLSPAELVEATGKRRAASQAAALARMGVPFGYTGRAVQLPRSTAQAHALLPERATRGGVDLSRVR